MARELYGPELMKKRVLELNASHARGINVIREKVKSFASIAVGRETVAGYPCPPYKLIILDEADAMTQDAQSALRRTMEQFTKVTRFCIICNYVSRIIEPITSRCAKFRFQPLAAPTMISRLQTICSDEHINIAKPELEQLVSLSEGDLRRAITLLQSARRVTPKSKPVSREIITSVAGAVPLDVLQLLIQAARANSYATIQVAAQEFILSGYPVDQALTQLLPLIVQDPSLSNVQKSRIAMRMAESDKKLLDGADEQLQLTDILSVMATTMANDSA